MASNGVAIGYGQRDSGVRYMPVSPSVGLAAGQASIGAALQDASRAFLHSSAAVAELELNAQRDQLDKLGTDIALRAERDYSTMVYGDPAVPGSGFINRMDAENFVPEYEERFKSFRESALQSVPAPLRDRIDQHLQKIRTRQFVELNGLSARQSREALARSRGAYAEFCADAGDMAGMEEAVRAIPGLTPEEQELRIAKYKGAYEKAVTVRSQAANHADLYHQVTNDPQAATQFLLEMQSREAYQGALSVYGGKSKVDELIAAARAQVDADGFAGADEFRNTGNAKGLANAAMGGNFTAAELEVFDALASGSPGAVSLRQASMEMDISAAPEGRFESQAMRVYLAERESVWKALGASEQEMTRARDAIKAQSEKTNGRLKVEDLLKRAAAARPHYFLRPGDEFRNGLKYRKDVDYKKWAANDADMARAKQATGLDLKGENLRQFLRDEQAELLKNDKAWIDARVAARFNDWMATPEGQAATKEAQKQKFVDFLGEETKMKLTWEEIFGSRARQREFPNGEEKRESLQEIRENGGNALWQQAVPRVDSNVLTPGVFVPEGTEIGEDSVVLMSLPNGKAVQVPALGTSGSDQFVVSGGASLRIKGFETLRQRGVRYRVMKRGAIPFERPEEGKIEMSGQGLFGRPLPAAEMIFKSEARFGPNGKLKVYHLPKSDGGGAFEVAGINEKYHPAEARKLKAMVEAGKQDEAKAEAVRYIDHVTRPVKQVFGSTHAPGAEAVVRDMYFNTNRGANEALNKVLGLSGGGLATKRAAVRRYIARHGEEAFIRAFSAARADYYKRRAEQSPEKRRFLAGWLNRVRSTQEQALAMMG